MAPHILMGEAATFRLAMVALFVLVSAIVSLGAGVVWLAARKERRR
jgi:hypothetical protein